MRLYPDTLPLMSWPDFSLSPADQSLRTDMEVGDQKVRRLTFARRDISDIAMRMSDAEFAAWRAWFGDEAWSLSGESDAFAAWTATRVTIALDGSGIGPSGQTVYAIRETATTGIHNAQFALTGLVPANATVVCRATLKASGRSLARLFVTNLAGTNCVAVVDLATGLITSSSNVVSVTVKDRGNGWYRVELVAVMGTGATTPLFRIAVTTDGTAASYAGDGVSGFLATEQQVRVYTGYDLYLPTDAAGNAQGASGGSAWFGMAMPVGGGMTVKQARFIGTYAAKPLQGLNWQVSGKVQVR